jgi:hypothetical protein
VEGVAQTSRQILDQTSHAGCWSLLERQDAPQLVAGTATASARTVHPVNVRTGRPHPAANHRQAAAKRHCPYSRWVEVDGGTVALLESVVRVGIAPHRLHNR